MMHQRWRWRWRWRYESNDSPTIIFTLPNHKEELSKCTVVPSQVFIAVMSDPARYHYKAKRYRLIGFDQELLNSKPTHSANDTWVQRARALGMNVKFFGTLADDSLPAINVVPVAFRKDAKKVREYQGIAGGLL